MFGYRSNQGILKDILLAVRWSYSIDPKVNVLKRLESNELYVMILKLYSKILKSAICVTYIR